MKNLTPYQLSKIVEILHLDQENRIVLIDISEEKDTWNMEKNLNVYMINKENQILWQIQAENTNFDGDMFVSLSRNASGNIFTSRFSGFEYEINPDTGFAKTIGWDK